MSGMMKRVCVTGTPGTGKTAVAKELARLLGWRLVEVNELAQGAVVGRDRRRGSKVVDVARLRPRVRRLSGVVLCGHFAHELPCDAVVVLRCALPELRRRLVRRRWSERKVRENVEAELFGVIEEEARGIGAERRVRRGRQVLMEEAREMRALVVVDTTRKSAKQAAAEALRALRRASGAGARGRSP